MPELTIASAASRTTRSSTRSAKWFQLFHPIGGVLASPLSGTSTTAGGAIRGGGCISDSEAGTAVSSSLPPPS